MKRVFYGDNQFRRRCERTGSSSCRCTKKVRVSACGGVVIHLKPDKTLKKPTARRCFLLRPRGSGVTGIGKETHVAGIVMLVERPAKIPHRWINENTSVFRELGVKVPKAAEETKPH